MGEGEIEALVRRHRGGREVAPDLAVIIVNFSHPLTDAQRAEIEARCGEAIAREIGRSMQLDDAAPLEDQVRGEVDAIGLGGEAWQVEPIVVVLPGLAAAAALVLAEIHGRTGYFPTIARLRPVPGSLPLRFDLAELIGLQDVRARARKGRR